MRIKSVIYSARVASGKQAGSHGQGEGAQPKDDPGRPRARQNASGGSRKAQQATKQRVPDATAETWAAREKVCDSLSTSLLWIGCSGWKRRDMLSRLRQSKYMLAPTCWDCCCSSSQRKAMLLRRKRNNVRAFI